MVATSNSAADILVQGYAYTAESLGTFVRELLAAVGGEASRWDLEIIQGAAGASVKTAALRDLSFEATANKPAPRFNRIAATLLGKNLVSRDVLRAKIVVDASPAGVDWAPVPEYCWKNQDRELRNALMTFWSQADFVSAAKLQRHPSAIVAQLWVSEAKDIAKTAVDVVSKIANCAASTAPNGFVIFADYGDLPLTTAAIALGGQSTAVSVMDTHFDMPHVITAGPPSVVDAYSSDLLSNYPNLRVNVERLTGASVLAFQEWPQVKGIFLPRWHHSRW